ncbi:hypothetical protein ACP4OV_012650 [Aristida adscensionis]
MTFDLLPSLRPREKHWNICVRVSRMWEYRGGTHVGSISHIDLVLIDKEGNPMYAEIPASEVDKKGPLVQEGGVYVMSWFRVSNAKTFYRHVDARYMIEFTCYTKIVPAKEDTSAFPMITYDLVPLSELTRYSGEKKRFLDVLGTVLRVTDLAQVQLPNQPAATQCRDVINRDLSSVQVKVTLWGQRAIEFDIDNIPDREPTDQPIVLFVGTLMKSFAGEDYLSGNVACRCYFNPTIPEAQPFYAIPHGLHAVVERVAAPVQQGPQINPELIEHKQIDEIEALDPCDFPATGYRCTVTIARLVPGTTWWFASCNRCSRACLPDGAGYRCSACSCNGFKFKYVQAISFIVDDGSAEGEMIAFGDIARPIVGKPVQVVLREAKYTSVVPLDIASIVCLRFTFGITITEQCFYKPTKSYQVCNHCIW